MRKLRPGKAKIGRVMQDTKPDLKYPAYEAFFLYIHYKKNVMFLNPPSPIPFITGLPGANSAPKR